MEKEKNVCLFLSLQHRNNFPPKKSHLISNNGEVLFTQTDILNEIENYFAQIFSFQSSPLFSILNVFYTKL